MSALGSRLARLARLARPAGKTLLALALVLPIVSWVADRTLGREVLLVSAATPAAVELNRALWMKGDPVAELYGSPASAPVRILVTDEARIVHPVEDPSLSIAFSGEGHPRPFQARTLWLLARLVGVGFAIAGFLVLALGALLSRPAKARAR